MLSFLLYIDPGSGSYLVQMLIAAAVGGLFYFKQIGTRIRTLFGSRKQKNKDNQPDAHG